MMFSVSSVLDFLSLNKVHDDPILFDNFESHLHLAIFYLFISLQNQFVLFFVYVYFILSHFFSIPDLSLPDLH